jgi:hypothetical protein
MARGTVVAMTGQRAAPAGPARTRADPGWARGQARSRIIGDFDVTPIRAGEITVYLRFT